MSAFFYTVVGVVLGGLISLYFARRASQELRKEADALRRETDEARHYVNALISYLEAAGQITVRRDEAGKPVQVQILRGGGIASPRASSYGVLTVTYPEHQNRTDAPQEDEDAEERAAQDEKQARGDSTEEAKGE
jgi:gas vesicle protein